MTSLRKVAESIRGVFFISKIFQTHPRIFYREEGFGCVRTALVNCIDGMLNG